MADIRIELDATTCWSPVPAVAGEPAWFEASSTATARPHTAFQITFPASAVKAICTQKWKAAVTLPGDVVFNPR